MKTAVIYARYSSEKQTDQSIEGQIRECTEYAKYHDILIVDTYIDKAMTGTNDNRTSFQKMLKDAFSKGINQGTSLIKQLDGVWKSAKSNLQNPKKAE